MFFLLSKLFWFVAAPSHVLAWLSIATAVFLFLGKTRPAKWTAAVGATLFVIFGVLPTGTWLLQQHESLYQRPVPPARVDGILILGGGNNPIVLRTRNALSNDKGVARLEEAFILSRRYPSARIVFSGGSGNPRQQQDAEGTSARRILLALGLDASRLTIEGKSRNTWENLIFTQAIVKPKRGEVWLLATSAFHLPRAMGIARRVGWTVLPWPTDYITPTRIGFEPEYLLDNLEDTELVFREYVGIAVYRLSGKSA